MLNWKSITWQRSDFSCNLLESIPSSQDINQYMSVFYEELKTVNVFYEVINPNLWIWRRFGMSCARCPLHLFFTQIWLVRRYVSRCNMAQVLNLSLQLQGAKEYNWCRGLFPHIPAALSISVYIYVCNRYQENEFYMNISFQNDISKRDKE
jgi:hypothetical protein